MNNIIIPKGYTPNLSLIETQVAIKTIKDLFERALAPIKYYKSFSTFVCTS